MKSYQDDLAHIHDVGFGGFAQKTAPWLVDLFRRCGISTGLVVELRCGSGILAQALCSAGYEVYGTDISQSMLHIALRRAPKATFSHCSWRTTKLPVCDAVVAIGEVVCYKFDEKSGFAELTRLFARVYQALRPSGVFVFDVAEPGCGSGRPQQHFAGKDWALLLEVEENKRQRQLSRHMTFFRKVGRNYRRSEEVHLLQLYTSAEIAGALREAGFRVKIVRSYGIVKFPKRLVGFIATRPE